MRLYQQIMKELFEDNEFVYLLNCSVDDMRENPIEDTVPQKWEPDGLRIEMNQDIYEFLEKCRKDKKRIYISITASDDTMFSFLSVLKPYASLMIFCIKRLGLNYETLTDFDPFSYDWFNENNDEDDENEDYDE